MLAYVCTFKQNRCQKHKRIKLYSGIKLLEAQNITYTRQRKSENVDDTKIVPNCNNNWTAIYNTYNKLPMVA